MNCKEEKQNMKRKILVETPHCAMLESRFRKDGKRFKAIVSDGLKLEDEQYQCEAGVEVCTTYEGETIEDLEQVIHKVWLDLMTNLHNGFPLPIKVEIKEI